MNLETLMQSQIIVDIGTTLLHSLWQITLVAAGLFLVLTLIRRTAERVRYLASVIALALAFLAPLITFVLISTESDIGTFSSKPDPTAVIDRTRDAASFTQLPGGGWTTLSTVPANTDEPGRLAGISNWFTRNIPQLPATFAILWILGVLFFSIRLLGGVAELHRYRTSGRKELDEYWQQTISDLSARIGLRRPVELFSSLKAQTPIAIGFLKPVILIPAGLFLQMHPRELETIIAHELIHIRRYDPLVNLAQCAIESLLFYHPAIWWISARIRQEREFVADAMVTEIFEGSHVTYARALANLEEIRLRMNEQTPRYATAANGGNFMQRIQRILKIKTERSKANSAWTAGLALILTSAFLLALFSFSSSELVNAQQKSPGSRKLAIGFVSIPPLDRTANPPKDGDATARLLIQKLKEYKIPATGFLMGGMISDGEKLYPVRANIARLWIDAGLEVGLGGFKHLKLYDTPADEYIANIEKNETIAKKLIGDTGMPTRYFSYPFLNTGRTDDRAKVESWLSSRGYTSVKYTIDNQEWMYSFAYDMARNDNDVNTMKEIREAYLSYMSKMFDHFEAYSTEMFGRDIPQTMVMTPSALTAHTADDLFGMAVKRGYTFVSVDAAQSDPAYKTAENFVGPGGISWFERWTMAKGQKLRHEPDVDQFIMRTWNDKKHAAKR